jgi:hypothetical protein
VSKTDKLELLTVDQVRRDPIISRAIDLALEASVLTGLAPPALLTETTVLRLIAWAQTRLGGAIHADPPAVRLAAAMYQLLAVLGADPVDLWALVSRDLREQVVAEVRADVVRRARGGAA